MKNPIWLIVPAAAVLILYSGCEKEEGPTGPEGSGLRPTHAVVEVDKSAVLSAGRDSLLWQIKLYSRETPFRSAYGVNLMTDRHGYFLQNGAKERMIFLETDGNGEATTHFYGSREPGISTTLIWGEGFGLDTVTVSVIIDYPYYVRLKFADPVEQIWGDTDTLTTGTRFSKPDSTWVRATVLYEDETPVVGIPVDLVAMFEGFPVQAGLQGYFKTAADPERGSANGRVITNALGEAMDTYYSDFVPAYGDPRTVEIIAVVDSAMFGNIASRKFMTIVPP
ncbi:MAG: hypothetical protein ACE5GH_03765 [Fidelibacterota bacterium]